MRKHITRFKRSAIKHRENVRQMPKHPFVIPVVTFLVMFIISAIAFVGLNGQTINPTDSHVVKLYMDGKQQTLPTRAQTVGDLLNRLNIKLAEHDVVEPARDAVITDDNYSVNVYRAQPVTIVEAGKPTITTYSAQKSPHAIVKQAGTTVYPEDKVELKPPTDILRDGIAQQVVIDRATPIKLNLYGVVYDVRTHADTVADVMKERGISYDSQSVLPAPTQAIKANDMIYVTNPGHQIAMVEEPIPFAETTVNDPNTLAGQTVVQNQGVAGKKVVVYEIAKDGSRKALQEVVMVEPVNKVTAKGTKIVTVAISGDKSSILSAAGVPLSQQQAADFVIARESGWRLTARNGSGCIGLGQACPGAKLVSACPNWQTDAVCQVQFFSGYANSRYGSWQGAYESWLIKHWW